LCCYLINMCYEKKDIRNNKTDIYIKKVSAAYNFLVLASHKPG
jgi:hypothetical protein